MKRKVAIFYDVPNLTEIYLHVLEFISSKFFNFFNSLCKKQKFFSSIFNPSLGFHDPSPNLLSSNGEY